MRRENGADEAWVRPMPVATTGGAETTAAAATGTPTPDRYSKARHNKGRYNNPLRRLRIRVSADRGSVEFVEEARRNRRRYGGAMRQVGILAAGALYALEHNIGRLVEDHQKAAQLADLLCQVSGLELIHPVQTNIIIADVSGLEVTAEQTVAALREHGVLCGLASPTRVRFVMHLDVSSLEVRAAGEEAARLLPRLAREATR